MFIFAIVHSYVFGFEEFKSKMLNTESPRSLAFRSKGDNNPVNRTVRENTKDFIRLDDVKADAD